MKTNEYRTITDGKEFCIQRMHKFWLFKWWILQGKFYHDRCERRSSKRPHFFYNIPLYDDMYQVGDAFRYDTEEGAMAKITELKKIHKWSPV